MLRKEFIPKRGRNIYEGEENCILRKFVTGKSNNGMKNCVEDRAGKRYKLCPESNETDSRKFV